jgi:hypothetical protein
MLSILRCEKGMNIADERLRNLRVNMMLPRERMCSMSRVMDRLRGMGRRMRI